MAKVFAIHGAFSTPNSFNYLKRTNKKWGWHLYDYSSDYRNIRAVTDRAYAAISEPCHLVGHSLGGLIALSISHHPLVRSVTTVASPLDGLTFNFFLSFLGRNSFITEINKQSSYIAEMKNKPYSIPIQHIIATQGYNPFMTEPNDGVVTIRSQKTWAAGKQHELSCNHNETLQSDKFTMLLRSFVKKHEKVIDLV